MGYDVFDEECRAGGWIVGSSGDLICLLYWWFVLCGWVCDVFLDVDDRCLLCMVLCCYVRVIMDVNSCSFPLVLYDAFFRCLVCDGFDSFLLFYLGFGDWASVVLGVYDGWKQYGL